MSDFILEVGPRLGSLEDLDRLLLHMVKHNGSDLFLLGSKPIMMSRYGRKERITRRNVSDTEIKNMLAVMYNQNAPSMLGAGQPIDTSYEFVEKNEDENDFKRERFRFRVNAIGCLRGGRKSLTITMRSIPTLPPHWEDLGIERSVIDVCRTIDQGLIMVVGATGNGKSTLLASMLRDRLEEENSHTNLVTIEHPIEFVYDEIQTDNSFITQMQVGTDIMSFHDGVRNSLRMAPNMILIGETRDLETSQAALEASMTGHGVLTTLHSNNVPETIQRMVYFYPKESQPQAKLDVVQSSRMIIAQRLLPTVEGGRVAIREIMIFDQDDKDKIMESDNVVSTAFKIVDSKGSPMVEDAKRKLDEGKISKETFKRVEDNYNVLKEKANDNAL